MSSEFQPPTFSPADMPSRRLESTPAVDPTSVQRTHEAFDEYVSQRNESATTPAPDHRLVKAIRIALDGRNSYRFM